ncbi:MAG: hypothetical protein N3D75_03705 [Candidatus Aenigmarchaeota archaeon]|nr:hypothetical protein [Candidatus Aenigmarchaeota archaeon]
MQKYLLFAVLVLILVNPVLAVTASCGSPVAPGDYRFRNFDAIPVRVFINTAGTSVSASPNGFTIPVGGEQIVQLRAPTDTYIRLFVTYTDTVNNFSASIECPMFASSGSSGGYTTTTTQSSGSCSSYTSSSACRSAGCTWITIGLSGYCTGSGSTVTTTTVETTSQQQTTTTTPFTVTTTTLQSSCTGRSFTTCPMVPGCEWVGSPTTGYCRSVSSTTTTVTATTTTTTTTIQSNPSSGGSSGGSSSGSSGSSSGGSSSGSSGSSSGDSSGKSTGFYDVPSFVQVPANGEKQIKASFYAAKDLTDVRFQVADVDANWFVIQPSSMQTIAKGETVNLTITIKVPENAKQDSYVLKLVAKTNVNYEKALTLAVTEKVEAPVTTPVTTTTMTQETKPTGFFVSALDLAKTYWYALAIPVVLIIALVTLPLLNDSKYARKKGTAYAVEESEYDYKQDHVEIKLKEPEVKQVEQQPKQDNYKIRNKVIKEIRERALKDSKKRY